MHIYLMDHVCQKSSRYDIQKETEIHLATHECLFFLNCPLLETARSEFHFWILLVDSSQKTTHKTKKKREWISNSVVTNI